MRISRSGIPPVLGLALLVLAAGAHAPEAPATTIRVPADQPTLEAGIGGAAAGDTVLVAPGVYTGPGNRNLSFGGKDLVVRSEEGARVTIIDCEQSGRGFAFVSGETSTAVLEGLTVENALVSGVPPAGFGAGLLCDASSPTLLNCTFSSNEASEFGGGAAILGSSSPALTGCVFSDNSAGDGGGISCQNASPTLTGCTFLRNTSSMGGGMGCGGERAPILVDCVFTQNSAAEFGGGFFAGEGAAPSFTGCTFTSNSAKYGGALQCNSASPVLLNCTLWENTAELGGGGIFVDFMSSPVMTGCALVGNSAPIGGAINLDSTTSPIMTGCTFSRNEATSSGGGVSCTSSSSPTFTGCIFIDNSAPNGAAIIAHPSSTLAITSSTFARNAASAGAGAGLLCVGCSATIGNAIIAFSTQGDAVFCAQGGTVALTCSDLHGNAGGDWTGCIAGQEGVAGNLATDPLFCSPASQNYGLAEMSPCAPAQAGACGLIGALPVACVEPEAVAATTWGAIKAGYLR